MSDPFDYYRISMLPSVGPARGRALLARFSSFAMLLRSRPGELREVEGIQRQLASRIQAALAEERRSGDIERGVEESRRLCEQHGIRFLPFPSPDYPAVLRTIYDPPLFLFARGTLTAADVPAVAVVGTRSPSDYGRQVAEDFCRGFSAAGVTVVSGLAMGIDTVAHRATLRAGGRTIAVLGSGLLNVYPGVNRALAGEIAGQGCLVSELSLRAKPDAVNFPRRNRIISGLSRSLVVVESDARGGAMITAGIALDQNRDLFAVPGSIYNPRSAGPHRLLRESMAQAATCPADVLGELLPQPTGAARVPRRQLTIEEQRLVDLLGSEPRHIDDLAIESGQPLPSLLAELLLMELNGIVRQLPGKYFTSSAAMH